MKDRAGNELEPGDRVLYLEPGTSSSRLVWGTVDRFTPQMVVLQNRGGSQLRRHPASVVKPFKEACTYDCGFCHADEEE